MESKKILIIGPWIGEFGWEVAWSGICRKKAKNYDYVVVSSFNTSYPFYSDFCDYFIAHNYQGVSDLYSMKNITKEIQIQFSKKMASNFKDDFKIDFMYPFRDWGYIPSGSFKMINLRYNPIPDGDYNIDESLTGIDKQKHIDICIHARNRPVGNRDWDFNKWDQLCEYFHKKGYSICCIGTKEQAYKPKHCIDLRGINLAKTMKQLKNVKINIGPSSGPMHLGQLCGAKTLVWGYGAKNHHGRLRYEKIWNFHNSPVKFIGEYEFNPPVEKIIEEFKIIMDVKK
jgi:ADP-heptose:LPS heptosyltransferase